ncbi:DUF6882 domain-containing protein [Corynebacterium sp. H128]|uniref:DUF6882 domain-containing protein n=1 Tax=Corynebacterium sp. H128 TaxID=3133427 RepID=UPI0030B64F54
MALFNRVPRAQSPVLHTLIADHCILTLEAQETLGDCAGDEDWAVDISTGTIAFGESSFPVQVLGTLEGSVWQWAWHDRGFAERLDHPAISGITELQGRAQELQIPEFAEPSIKIDELNDLGLLPGAGLASVAAQLIGFNAFFGGDIGQATMFFAVDIPLDEPRMEDLNRYTQQAFHNTDNIEDALRLWAAKRNSRVLEIDGGIKVTLPDDTFCEFFLN